MNVGEIVFLCDETPEVSDAEFRLRVDKIKSHLFDLALKDRMKGERHTFSAEEWCADNAEDILFVIRLFRVGRRYDNGMMSLPIQAPFKQRCRR